MTTAVELPEGITAHEQPNGSVCYYKDSTHNYFSQLAAGKVKGKMDSPSFISGFIDPSPGGLLPWTSEKTCVGAAALRDVIDPSEWGALWDEGGQSVWRALREHKLTPNELRDQAGDRGTTVHDYFEQRIRGERGAEGVEGLEAYTEAIDKFLADHQPSPLEVEEVYYDETNNIAGRADARTRFETGAYKGKVAMLDLKTSKSIALKFHVQVKGYALMAQAAGWGTSDLTLLLHCPGDGNYYLIEGRATDDDWAACVDAAARKRALSARIRSAK